MSNAHQVKRSEVPIGKMVRRFRLLRRMSVRNLAAKSGFSPSFISQVELGQSSPSIASTERLASGLGITLGDFFTATLPSRPAVVKAKDRLVLESGWSRGRIESLGPGGEDSALETLLVTLKPRGATASRPYASDTEQMMVVFRGTARLTLENEIHLLDVGDAAAIPAGTRHMWENVSSKPVQIFIVTIRTNR